MKNTTSKSQLLTLTITLYNDHQSELVFKEEMIQS